MIRMRRDCASCELIDIGLGSDVDARSSSSCLLIPHGSASLSVRESIFAVPRRRHFPINRTSPLHSRHQIHVRSVQHVNLVHEWISSPKYLVSMREDSTRGIIFKDQVTQRILYGKASITTLKHRGQLQLYTRWRILLPRCLTELLTRPNNMRSGFARCQHMHRESGNSISGASIPYIRRQILQSFPLSVTSFLASTFSASALLYHGS
jgi:hypothetical protein